MAENTGILLESGTNELELLEFEVGTQHYGINVAKINELCPYQAPTPVPNAHEYFYAERADHYGDQSSQSVRGPDSDRSFK